MWLVIGDRSMEVVCWADFLQMYDHHIVRGLLEDMGFHIKEKEESFFGCIRGKKGNVNVAIGIS